MNDETPPDDSEDACECSRAGGCFIVVIMGLLIVFVLMVLAVYRTLTSP